MKRTLLLLMAALFALALFAPAAMAQDDDGNDDADDDGAASASASASASSTATATAAADDIGDDDRLPRTGGPALLAPIAGALLMAGGAASVLALRRVARSRKP